MQDTTKITDCDKLFIKITGENHKSMDYYESLDELPDRCGDYKYTSYKKEMENTINSLFKIYCGKPIKQYYENKLMNAYLGIENYGIDFLKGIYEKDKNIEEYYEYFKTLHYAEKLLEWKFMELYRIEIDMGRGYYKKKIREYEDKSKENDFYHLDLTIKTGYSYKDNLEELKYAIKNSAKITIIIKNDDEEFMDVVKENIVKNKNLIVIHFHYTNMNSIIEKLFNHIVLKMEKDVQIIVNKKNTIDGYKFYKYYNNRVYIFRFVDSKFISFENIYDIKFIYKNSN
jgi:hypothetical protein